MITVRDRPSEASVPRKQSVFADGTAVAVFTDSGDVVISAEWGQWGLAAIFVGQSA